MAPQIDRHMLSLILSGRAGAPELDSFSPADWDLLLKQAQEEGVAPLVYWTLSRSGMLSCMPASIQSTLRAMYVSLRMNNEALLKELESLMRQFDRAAIPVIALKGVCFALTLYPDIGLRPMVDLDLLVPASQSPKAVRLIRACGYGDLMPEASFGLAHLLDYAVGLKKET